MLLAKEKSELLNLQV